MKKVSRGQMFSVQIDLDSAKLEAMKNAPELAQIALQEGARYWHDNILPDHFKAGIQSKYAYAPRSRKYLKYSKKVGKPLLVLTGSMRRDLMGVAAYKQKARTQVELRMFARVLNLAPAMPQNSDDLYVYRSNGKRYPNTKREVKVVTDDERAAIAKVVEDVLAGLFNAAGQPTASILPRRP